MLCKLSDNKIYHTRISDIIDKYAEEQDQRTDCDGDSDEAGDKIIATSSNACGAGPRATTSKFEPKHDKELTNMKNELMELKLIQIESELSKNLELIDSTNSIEDTTVKNPKSISRHDASVKITESSTNVKNEEELVIQINSDFEDCKSPHLNRNNGVLKSKDDIICVSDAVEDKSLADDSLFDFVNIISDVENEEKSKVNYLTENSNIIKESDITKESIIIDDNNDEVTCEFEQNNELNDNSKFIEISDLDTSVVVLDDDEEDDHSQKSIS